MNLLQKIRSVRFVLTLWYSVILLIAFSIFGISVYYYLKHLQEAELQQNLLEEVDWISHIVDLERTRMGDQATFEALSSDVEQRIAEHFTMSPRNYIVMLTSLEGNILYESENRGRQILLGIQVPAHAITVQSLQTTDNGTLRVAARRADPFIIQVAYTEGAMQSVLGHLLSIFALLVPVVLFVSFAGGWLMAGMVLRPISQISRLATRITAQNLSERIPERHVDDELGQLIRTINGMIARLQSSFDQIREFSINVAHELKTPLTILKGESELALTKAISSEETQQLITSYLEETVRMSRIVDDLLTLARADAGQITIQKEPVALDQLIRELYEDAAILSAQKHLTVQLEADQAAVVLGDAARLRQLFRVLLSNAVQYTDPGGAIRIRCRRANGAVEVEIEDTGIGIPPESLEKIFQRFYRVDNARSRDKGGSGLGLSVAKWITEAHNGSITVRSTLGAGSCFTVRLPLHPR